MSSARAATRAPVAGFAEQRLTQPSAPVSRSWPVMYCIIGSIASTPSMSSSERID